MTYLVRLTTYAASRAKDGLPIRDQDGFVAISSTGSRPESHSAEQQIADLGWRAEKETSRLCQLVRIELPEGVDYCPFEFAGLGLHGPHTTNASARDGNGPIVFTYVGKPASIREAGSDEAAFAAALDSGIFLSVPQPDGTRREVRAKVLAVSPIYADHFPADFSDEYDAQTDREFNTRIR